LHTIRCEGRGYKDVCWRLLKNGGMGNTGLRESMWRDWTDQSKAHTHRGHILRHPFEC
jgi:hypothetical protein